MFAIDLRARYKDNASDKSLSKRVRRAYWRESTWYRPANH